MIFPENWIAKTPTNPRVTYCFTVEENHQNAQVLMTINQFDKKLRPQCVQFACQMMTNQLSEEKYHMVEHDVEVQILRKDNGLGYYFMATDKDWLPESTEWPYLLRCMYVGTHTLVELTVLCYNQESNTIKQAFELFDNNNI